MTGQYLAEGAPIQSACAADLLGEFREGLDQFPGLSAQLGLEGHVRVP